MNSKHLWALSPEAKQHLDELVAKGIDPDLALSLMETLVPEQAIYSLDEAEDE